MKVRFGMTGEEKGSVFGEQGIVEVKRQELCWRRVGPSLLRFASYCPTEEIERDKEREVAATN